ncbi:hypothetical protein, partial [Rubrivirga sp.]|uniref:hypothetical protein n=1 Tax=Rubrivirga sp. TaxID=1885344 RepID=UPI003C73C3DD
PVASDGAGAVVGAGPFLCSSSRSDRSFENSGPASPECEQRSEREEVRVLRPRGQSPSEGGVPRCRNLRPRGRDVAFDLEGDAISDARGAVACNGVSPADLDSASRPRGRITPRPRGRPKPKRPVRPRGRTGRKTRRGQR